MKERFSTMVTRVLETARDERTAANRRFQEALAEARQVRSSARELDEHAESVLAELRTIAEDQNIVLVSDQFAERADLGELPLREIEQRLGVVIDDRDYGRTRYVDVYPREMPESPAEAEARERAYDAAVSRLRRAYPGHSNDMGDDLEAPLDATVGPK